MSFELTIVPTQNTDGEELSQLIRTWATNTFGQRARIEVVRSEKDLGSAFMSDIIVLDLSVAPESEHNYNVLARFPHYHDSVFFVSRTPIPFNVRWGIHRKTPLFPKQQTNREIIDWLAEELPSNMLAHYKRGWLEKMKFAARSTVQWQMWDHVEAAKRRQERNFNRLSRAFISFRGKDIDATRRLVQKIQRAEISSHEQLPRQIVLYDGEILALRNELLPPLLRWQVLAIISDDILSSTDFVVMQSDSYLNSWWTQAELFTSGYFVHKPRIHVYDVSSEQFIDDVKRYQVSLSEEEKDTLKPFFTNTHPELMAPESAEIYRFMKANPRWVTRLEPVRTQIARPQFDERFEQLMVLQCDSCTKREWGTTVPRDFFDTFISPIYPVTHLIEPERLERAVHKHELLSCPDPICKQKFVISAPPPHYLWYPPHLMQKFLTEIKKQRLVLLQTYLAQEV